MIIEHSREPWYIAFLDDTRQLIWGAIVNRTYGTRENLYMFQAFLRTIFGPVNYGPP